MLEVREGQAAFHPLSAMHVVEAGTGLFCAWRGEGAGRVLATVNVTCRRQKLSVPAGDGGMEFLDLMSGETVKTANGVLELELAPYRVAWWQGAADQERA